MLTRGLSEVVSRTKMHKEGYRNMYLFLLNKVLRFWGQTSSTALVIDTLCQILLCTSAVLENWPQFCDNFFKVKYF